MAFPEAAVINRNVEVLLKAQFNFYLFVHLYTAAAAYIVYMQVLQIALQSKLCAREDR